MIWPNSRRLVEASRRRYAERGRKPKSHRDFHDGFVEGAFWGLGWGQTVERLGPGSDLSSEEREQLARTVAEPKAPPSYVTEEIPALFSEAGEDPDTGFIVGAAVRYAMGRRTYAPWLVTEWVKRYWDCLTPVAQRQLLRDVEEEISRHERTASIAAERDGDAFPGVLGDRCDAHTWYSFREWIRGKLGLGATREDTL